MSNWVTLHRIKVPGLNGGVAYEQGTEIEVNLDQVLTIEPTDPSASMRGHACLTFSPNNFMHVWETFEVVRSAARYGEVKQAVLDKIEE